MKQVMKLDCFMKTTYYHCLYYHNIRAYLLEAYPAIKSTLIINLSMCYSHLILLDYILNPKNIYLKIPCPIKLVKQVIFLITGIKAATNSISFWEYLFI